MEFSFNIIHVDIYQLNLVNTEAKPPRKKQNNSKEIELSKIKLLIF